MAMKSKNFYLESVNIFPEDDGCHNELLQSRAEGCVARVTPQIRLSVPPAKPLLFLQQGLLAPFYFSFFFGQDDRFSAFSSRYPNQLMSSYPISSISPHIMKHKYIEHRCIGLVIQLMTKRYSILLQICASSSQISPPRAIYHHYQSLLALTRA